MQFCVGVEHTGVGAKLPGTVAQLCYLLDMSWASFVAPLFPPMYSIPLIELL